MATMYSLFFGLLFTVICSDNGDGSGVLKMFKASFENGFYSLYQGRDFHFFLDEKTKQTNQGLVAYPKFNLCSLKIKTGTKWSSAKLNSPDKSGSNSLIFSTRPPFKILTVSQPRPFYSGSANRSICTKSKNVAFDIFKNLKEEAQSIVLKISSDEFLRTFCGKKYEPCHGSSGMKAKHSGMEDNNKIKNNKTLLAESRQSIIAIASKELGTHEATGNNDGPRIEQYLRYTNLGKGYEWCAAFVSWVYGQAGLSQPRNPWSPALFPKARQIDKVQAMPADVFGIYGIKAKRINHVGLVKGLSKDYLITIEGNSNNRVESRRRHVKTIYAVADWVNE